MPRVFQPGAVLGRGQLVVGAAGDDRNAQRRDGRLVEDRAERIGAEHVGFERQDFFGSDDLAAGGVGELLGLGGVEVGDRQLRAFGGGVERDPGGDAARALDRDVQPGDAVLAELVADRRLQAEKDAERGVRAGIAADRRLRPGARRRYLVWRRTSIMSLTLMPTSSAVT